MCAQRSLRSACASVQSDQNIRRTHGEAFGPWLLIEHQEEPARGAQEICMFCRAWAHMCYDPFFSIRETRLQLLHRMRECQTCPNDFKFLVVPKSIAECSRGAISVEPKHDKTSKMTCAPSEDTDQPRQPPCLIRVFAVRFTGS